MTEFWGGSAELEYEFSWPGGSFSAEAVAVESTSYTSSAGASVSDGYVIAIKNSSSWAGEETVDWTLNYVDSKGVIDDGKRPVVSSIKDYESLFGSSADLDGDGATGINTADLTTLSTDATGDLLKVDAGGSYYIFDDETNEVYS